MSLHRPTRRPHGDRGDIILGWLTKLTLVLAVLGVLGYDGVSLGVAQFAVADDASTAARAAANAYRGAPDAQAAYDAAYAEVAESGETIDAATFRVAADGNVTLTVHRPVATLLVHRVPPLRSWTTASSTASAVPSG